MRAANTAVISPITAMRTGSMLPDDREHLPYITGRQERQEEYRIIRFHGILHLARHKEKRHQGRWRWQQGGDGDGPKAPSPEDLVNLLEPPGRELAFERFLPSFASKRTEDPRLIAHSRPRQFPSAYALATWCINMFDDLRCLRRRKEARNKKILRVGEAAIARKPRGKRLTRRDRSICPKGTDSLLCPLEQTAEYPPGRLYLLAGPVRRKDGYRYVAEKVSSLSATDGKEISHRDSPLHLR